MENTEYRVHKKHTQNKRNTIKPEDTHSPITKWMLEARQLQYNGSQKMGNIMFIMMRKMIHFYGEFLTALYGKACDTANKQRHLLWEPFVFCVLAVSNIQP